MKRDERLKEYQRNWIAARREKWIAKLGGKCLTCGATDELQFDHIDRAQKKYQISQIWSRTEETIAAELAKCQLLCSECHKAKTKAEFFIVHGLGRYYEGCRCEVCTMANRDKARRQRARKKSNNSPEQAAP